MQIRLIQSPKPLTKTGRSYRQIPPGEFYTVPDGPENFKRSPIALPAKQSYRRFPLRELQTVSNSSDRHKQIVSSVPVPRNLYSPQYLWLKQANRIVGSSPHKVGPADLEYIQNLNLFSQLRIGDLIHLGQDLATETVNKNA